MTNKEKKLTAHKSLVLRVNDSDGFWTAGNDWIGPGDDYYFDGSDQYSTDEIETEKYLDEHDPRE